MKKPFSSILLSTLIMVAPPAIAAVSALDDEDPIEIVEGEDRTVYEYRRNGALIMIKVVPKDGGRPYYMVPADGSAHFETLDHEKRLYPQWVILEW